MEEEIKFQQAEVTEPTNTPKQESLVDVVNVSAKLSCFGVFMGPVTSTWNYFLMTVKLENSQLQCLLPPCYDPMCKCVIDWKYYNVILLH